MFKWLFKKKGCAKHMNNKLEVIGIDHGWSMMKTISQVFVTGVKEITTTPALFGDVLEYEGKFYKVGTVRQEVKDTKVEDDSFYLLTLAAVPQNMQAVANGIPVYYQIPVVDGTGNVVQRLPIERSVRKSSNSGVVSLFARLSFKKKSRADIVKLVASGDLVPAQLVQIKSAIEKGLTESQLVELINNNISAEKMKEIIEIAVLENSMAD